jgi:hypothetical protein
MDTTAMAITDTVEGPITIPTTGMATDITILTTGMMDTLDTGMNISNAITGIKSDIATMPKKDIDSIRI